MVDTLPKSNSRIALVPNLPRGKHDERRKGLSSIAIDEDGAKPAIFGRLEVRSSGGVYRDDPKLRE
jgi:hypothetical protein